MKLAEELKEITDIYHTDNNPQYKIDYDECLQKIKSVLTSRARDGDYHTYIRFTNADGMLYHYTNGAVRPCYYYNYTGERLRQFIISVLKDLEDDGFQIAVTYYHTKPIDDNDNDYFMGQEYCIWWSEEAPAYKRIYPENIFKKPWYKNLFGIGGFSDD